MDEMTQRNGALVEQTSAAAQAMADQGRQLADLVGHFRLSGAAAAQPAVVRASVSKAAAPKAAPAKSAAAKPVLVASTPRPVPARSEEHTSELQSLMRISYAVFCLKKKKY